jgi:hypothetical protein
MQPPIEEIIYEDDFHKIGYNPTRDCVIYKASGAPKDSFHLRSGLLKILEIPKIMHRSTATYLADLREVTLPLNTENVWLNEVLLPQILHRGVKKMAWIVPTRVLPKMAIDYMVNRVVPISCELRFFDTPEDAQKWLDELTEGF